MIARSDFLVELGTEELPPNCSAVRILPRWAGLAPRPPAEHGACGPSPCVGWQCAEAPVTARS
jgi:hypothetical protein